MNELERHEAIFPFGAQVSSKSRRRFCRGKPQGPVWISHGAGAHVFDQSDRKYLDLTAGLGAITLGHRLDARTPRAYPLPTKSELLLADKIQDMVPWAERMRFLKNGGDATMAAVRLARVYTGRSLIIDFGNYHGCQDPWIDAVHEGVPNDVRAMTLKLKADAINLSRVDTTVACVILEATPLTPLPDGFIQALRLRCTKTGTPLIFDDVISGFRAHPQGAAGITRIQPDLTCAGKAMANGWPISVVYGKKELMSCWERTHLSATHWAEPSAMDAAVQTLSTMIDEDFWAKQKAWSFGGQPNNGHWAVTKLPDDEQTFVQSQLLDAGIITNLSQFFYLDLAPYASDIERAFTAAFAALDAAKKRGDVASQLDCQVNTALFKRNG